MRSLRSTQSFCQTLAITLCVLLLAAAPGLSEDSASRHRLAGQVLDSHTGDAMPGVAVRLLSNNQVTTTDKAGRFVFEGVAAGEHSVGFHFPGFNGQHVTVLLPQSEDLAVRMTLGRSFSEEIVISATPWAADRLEVAHAVDVVDKGKLRARSGLSLGEAVEDVPGTRNVSTGDQAGIPMIRGLSNERIKVLTDGFAHSYQQFSLRHPPNVEPYDYDRIEVVRGPASLLYGPEAMGGVINMVSEPLPSARGSEPSLSGETLVAYASGNESLTGRVEADGAQGGLGWRASWTRRSAGNQETPTGELDNTGYEQSAGSLALGYSFEGGARARIFWNHWESELGFYLPPLPDFFLALRNDVYAAEVTLPSSLGQWKFSAHHAQNIRRALPLGRGGPVPVDLDLETDTIRTELEHKGGERLRGWVIAEHSSADNSTRGGNPLVPNFDNETWSAAIYEELRLGSQPEGSGRYLLSGGLRYDTRELSVSHTPGREDLDGFTQSFSSLTGSLAFLCRVSPSLSLGASLGRGWRAPSEHELFAQGRHGGIFAFERGNPELVEETNFGSELSMRWISDRFRGSVALYRNEFDDHIYAAFTDEMQGELPVVQYQQANATIKGFEGQLEYNATKALTLFGATDHLSTQNKATGQRLPVTPPDRVTLGLRLHGQGWHGWHHPFLELRGTWYDDGVASGPDELFSQEGTESYTLIDAHAGIHLFARQTDFIFHLSVTNLANRKYLGFLDTYKQWTAFGALSPGRSIRTTLRVVF